MVEGDDRDEDLGDVTADVLVVRGDLELLGVGVVGEEVDVAGMGGVDGLGAASPRSPVWEEAGAGLVTEEVAA